MEKHKNYEFFLLSLILVGILGYKMNKLITVKSKSQNPPTCSESVNQVCKMNVDKSFRYYNFTVNYEWKQISQHLKDLVLTYEYKTYEFTNIIMYKPKLCTPKQCLAFLIPARDRESHLKQLMYHLPEILMQQNLCFSLFILDQFDNETIFNKAKLYNAAYTEIKNILKPIEISDIFDCLVFHDVDLLPQNLTIPYVCSLYPVHQPVHLSVALTKYGYHFSNPRMIGGVALFTPKIFENVNGWSNKFWGWGGEDDNMFYRVSKLRYEIQRPEFKCKLTDEMKRRYKRYIRSSDPFNCAKWQMIGHRRDKNNPENISRKKFVKKVEIDDGLTNLNYSLKSFNFKHEIFNYILIDNEAPYLKKYDFIASG